MSVSFDSVIVCDRKDGFILIFGTILPFEPAAETIEAREENPFGDVRLLEFLTDFPLYLVRDDYFAD